MSGVSVPPPPKMGIPGTFPVHDNVVLYVDGQTNQDIWLVADVLLVFAFTLAHPTGSFMVKLHVL